MILVTFYSFFSGSFFNKAFHLILNDLITQVQRAKRNIEEEKEFTT